MADPQKRTRFLGALINSRSGLRRFITLGVVSAVCASFIATLPAKATSSHQTGPATSSASTPALTGMNAALAKSIAPAPAGFRVQLENYFQQMAANAGQYGNNASMAGLVQKADNARKLVAMATDQELNSLNFVVSEMPNWQQAPKMLKRVAKAWKLAQKISARDHTIMASHKVLSAHDISNLGCTLLGQWTVDVDVATEAAYQLSEIIDSWVADSQLVVILGFGITSPVSGYKAVTSFFKVALHLIYETADGIYQIWYGCEEDAHRAQVDTLNSYVDTNTSVKTLAVHATDLGDAYHYQFTVQFEGQPIDPSSETLTAINVPTGGTPTVSDITSQVTFVRLDTGVYQFTVPTSSAGTAYRLKIEYDNGQDSNGHNLSYFGDTVFTKLTQ